MTRLNLLVLRAHAPDALARFYAGLGLEFVRHRHGAGPEHYACESDAGVFEIYPALADGPSRGVRLGFAVPDVHAAVGQALAAGGHLVSAPAASPWGLRAVIADLEGHRVELSQRGGQVRPATRPGLPSYANM